MRKDLSVKFDLYRRHGVKEYWVVDPANRCLLVYVLDTGGRYPGALPICRKDAVVASTVIKELSVDLGRVFKEE